MEMKERRDPRYFYQFRIIIIGDSTVGKSSLLRQFTEGQYIQSSDPTVGVDFHVRVLQLNGRPFFPQTSVFPTLYLLRYKLI